jgi:hypothetical protein
LLRAGQCGMNEGYDLTDLLYQVEC